jgi:hypothetical protein
VGQGRAGKTSTLASLNGKAFVDGQASTIGLASGSILCELSQQAVRSWKPNTNTLDATQTALARHMAGRTGQSGAASIADVLAASQQDPSSQEALAAAIAANAEAEATPSLSLGAGQDEQPEAVKRKSSFFASLRKKPTGLDLGHAGPSQREEAAAQKGLPVSHVRAEKPTPPPVQSILEDSVSRMGTDFLASKAAASVAADKALVFDT